MLFIQIMFMLLGKKTNLHDAWYKGSVVNRIEWFYCRYIQIAYKYKTFTKYIYLRICVIDLWGSSALVLAKTYKLAHAILVVIA